MNAETLSVPDFPDLYDTFSKIMFGSVLVVPPVNKQ